MLFGMIMDFLLCSTFGMVDSEEVCIVVMVYNTADSWGVLIGDTVVIPEPQVKRNSITHKDEVSVNTCRIVSLFTTVSKRCVSLPSLSGSRLTSGVYEWTLLCSSSSTARNKTSKVRSPPPSATSRRANELEQEARGPNFLVCFVFSWILKKCLGD